MVSTKARPFTNWHTSATQLPAARSGGWSITHEHVAGLKRPYWGMDGIDEVSVTGTLTRLMQGDTEWMVDDPARLHVMQKYASQAKGDVLVGGLGLGLLVEALSKQSDVDRITVVEQSPEVLKLVAPDPRPLGIRYVEGDFWRFVSVMEPGMYQTIIVDLWDDKADPYEVVTASVSKVAILRAANPDAKVIVHGHRFLSDYYPVAV